MASRVRQVFLGRVLLIAVSLIAMAHCDLTRPAACHGQDPVSGRCLDYRKYIHWVGSFTGHHTFWAGAHGEQMFVSDMESGNGRFAVVDISEPLTPTVIGSLEIPFARTPPGTVRWPHVYLPTWGSGMSIVDVADPAAPRVVGGIDEPCCLNSLALYGRYALLASGIAPQCLVVDVADPTSPTIVATLEVAVRDIAVSGDVGLFASSTGFHTVDLRDPLQPSIMGSVPSAGGGWAVDAAGRYAYVAAYDLGMHVVDIGDPTSPVHVATWSLAAPAAAEFVTICEPHVLLSGYGYGHVFLDVSDPTHPAPVGSFHAVHNVGPAVTAGERVFIVDTYHGVHMLELGARRSPATTDDLPISDRMEDVALSGNLVAVAAGEDGLEVARVSNFGRLEHVGSLDLWHNAHGVALQGRYAYLALLGGLGVVDLVNPASPELVGMAPSPGISHDVMVAGETAYMLKSWSPVGLQVFDVSDPTAPVLQGVIGTPGVPTGLDLGPGVALVTSYDPGSKYHPSRRDLSVIDVADPAAPRLVSRVSLPVWPGDVAVSDVRAYVSGIGGLAVYDVSDWESPALVRLISLPEHAGRVRVAGGRLLVGAKGELLLFDITQADHPVPCGSLPVPGDARAFCWSREFLYLAGDSPSLIGYPISCGMDVESKLLSRAPADGTPSAYPRISATPNPARDGAVVHLEIAQGGRALVEILDIAGRRVRTLFDADVLPGQLDLGWDGRNEEGHPVASGMYFTRIVAEGRESVTRIAIVR